MGWIGYSQSRVKKRKERLAELGEYIYLLDGGGWRALVGGVVEARQKDFSNAFVVGGALPGVKKV